ncbi:DUF3021 domain-containing protein [Streptococcus suis]|nr:DUF3021 domain-containing protein [Streptococcus suis]
MGSYYLEHFNQPTVMLICVSIWDLIGILFQTADHIFQQDWSLLKMSVTHFFIISFCYTPLAILAGWFRVKLSSLLFFWVLFMMIYALIFVINYRKMEGSIQDINSRL